MTMRGFVRGILLAEAFAVATYALGWWTVPVIAAVWALISRDRRAPSLTALCAAGGWATLLLLDAAKGPVGNMASRLGGVMGIPPAMLYAVTLLFPALLAWTAATIVSRAASPSSGPQAASS